MKAPVTHCCACRGLVRFAQAWCPACRAPRCALCRRAMCGAQLRGGAVLPFTASVADVPDGDEAT